jgi:hypothetical protein
MKRTLLIHPWAQKLRNGNPNPKSPTTEWWKELIGLFTDADWKVVQIGLVEEERVVEDEEDFKRGLYLKDLEKITLAADTFLCRFFLPTPCLEAGETWLCNFLPVRSCCFRTFREL